ncbi:hypothetical protein BGW38_006214 [Lunasporangiospora selenospora]|uniref:CotH protein n=1 Tax=Lunasporangiospora selenospora TaxID=979761 RepID=A0A9P6FMH9_9FUNG|nr:hypothetical protein BGW38_006214 [Lunasporangiospora selenospora]
MVRLLLGLAACAAAVLADAVTFNVVGIREDDKDEYGVIINGKVTKLKTSPKTYPLWSANLAGVDGPFEYRYVRLDGTGKIDQQEKVARKFPSGAAFTPNEFFERSHTIHELPSLPQVYENKLEQDSPFFREGFIGSIFIEGEQSQINYLNKGGKIANENILIKGVSLNLSGASAREYAKLAYQFKFPKKDRLLDLSTLKLRNAETDPTMMREKVYVDVLNSLGVPAQQAAYVRLFLNDRPIGLFVAMEEMKGHWVKKVLHPKVEKVHPGALWKMNSCCGHEGNLQWLGPTTESYVLEDIYKNILPGKNPKNDLMKDLIVFMKAIKEFDPKETENPIGYWNKHMDLDMFLKSMVMEFLAGAWDAYWKSGSNYQIYNDPLTSKWMWLPTDFDDTFGTAFEGKIESYRLIPKKNENGFESPLAQKLIIECPEINERFEAILKDTVNYVFKPDALDPRLEGYRRMLHEDIVWDRALPRVSKGKNNKFTVADLTKGLDHGVESKFGLREWIKKRAEEVQKSLDFKALKGTPGRVAPHVMNHVQSAYGIGSKIKTEGVKINVTSVNKPKAAAPVIAVAGGVKASPKASPKAPIQVKNTGANKEISAHPQNKDNSISKEGVSGDHKGNAAQSLKGQWAALGALLPVVMLAL